MTNEEHKIPVPEVLARVRSHRFHPLDEDNALTLDRTLRKPGIAKLSDSDWRVRLLVVRDLVRAGVSQEIEEGLMDPDENVRQVCAKALGVLKVGSSSNVLERVVREDENTMVRSQAVMALGQIESKASLELLRGHFRDDPSRDVRHQCELAIDQIEKGMGSTKDLLAAFESLDETRFNSLRIGSTAPNFSLPDTEGNVWRLNNFREKNWVVLIWVFADWCPVCHREFQELMALRRAFEKEAVQVVTLECHDRYRARVMVGKELEPSYWFAEQPFRDSYREQIWWPHLLDRAGAVAAMYGVDPMAFAVHAEYINRPSTVIVDQAGVVQFAYYGTFWGDRPSIEQTLDMIREHRFTFEHPNRLRV